MNKAVFFDRDGVINNEEGLYYIYRTEDFRFNPGIKSVLKTLSDRGYLLILITNQGGISKGLYTRKDAAHIHLLMAEELGRDGVHFSEVYMCPHHPDVENCLCRKPQTLLFEKAMARFNIDILSSWFVGDRETDIEAGRKVGLRTILVEPNQDMRFLADRII